MRLKFLCYDFAVNNEYYRTNKEKCLDDIYNANKNFDFDDLKTHPRLNISVDVEYEECFNRTDFLSKICSADEVEYSSYNEIIKDKSLYIFGIEARYEPKTNNFDLYMTERYIGKEKVPLDESEQKELNAVIKTFIKSAVEKYKTEKENASMDNKQLDVDYCSRIFYDIAHEDFKSAEEAFSVIRPAIENFVKSDEFENKNIGLYEAAEIYIDNHDWPEPNESVLGSKDFKKFDEFVSKYTELDKKGIEFTIDDKVFDKKDLNNTISKDL